MARIEQIKVIDQHHNHYRKYFNIWFADTNYYRFDSFFDFHGQMQSRQLTTEQIESDIAKSKQKRYNRLY